MDKAGARLSRQLEQAGFDAAMCAALAAEPVLAADETPVNVLAPGIPVPAAGQEEEDPQDGGKTASGAPHVLAIRTPDDRLTWLQALGSRRKEDVTAGVPSLFTGFLITDGSWAADVISILRVAHQAVEEARGRGDTALDPEQLEKLRQRHDEAAAFGITHNRLRDWHDGNHPGYALGCWLREYTEQVWLFTREFAVEWTSNRSSGPSKARNGTRPSPATGTPSARSPAGAASAATSTPPRTTASAPSTPSAPHSKENPGYRHSPH